MTQLLSTDNLIRWGRWVLVTAALLALPALAMAFNIGVPDSGQGVERVNWGPMDFAIMGGLLLGSGLFFEYASERGKSIAHRAAVGIAVLAGFGLVWVNLAVGMMDIEAGNLLYVPVLLVAVVGTAIGRFVPREASIAMFVAAGSHAIVVVIALFAGLGPTLVADALWIASWLASGLLLVPRRR